MEREEDTVRVWTGMNPLQATMMELTLRDNGIECFSGTDIGMLYAGGRYEISLWVPKKDEQQARQLLEQREEEMSAELDQQASDDDKEKA